MAQADDGGSQAEGEMEDMTDIATPLAWRPAFPADVDTIMAIQGVCHPDLQERAAVMADKLAAFPQGCRILEVAGAPVGYGLAHPWLLGRVPLLDALLPMPPAQPDCLYIHDVAQLPTARGHGAGRRYVALTAALARRMGVAALALVSVYGTYPLWERCGFRTLEMPGLADAFGPSGASARYMTAAVADLA